MFDTQDVSWMKLMSQHCKWRTAYQDHTCTQELVLTLAGKSDIFARKVLPYVTDTSSSTNCSPTNVIYNSENHTRITVTENTH